MLLSDLILVCSYWGVINLVYSYCDASIEEFRDGPQLHMKPHLPEIPESVELG